MQVKVISKYDEFVFESEVNTFLKDNDFTKIKVTYNTVFNENNEVLYVAFIEYQ